MPQQERAAYETPALIELGKFSDLTRLFGAGPNLDSATGTETYSFTQDMETQN